MQNPRRIEISVDSLAKALAAERGGAHRIELCSELSHGGLTPDPELLRSARELVRLPIFAMIRPRGGDFVYSHSEYAEMQRDMETARQLGADGLVLGILQRDGHVDVQRTRHLVQLARPLPVTFHRAIDVAAEIYKALADVMQTGAARVLTSGGAPSAPEGAACLATLVKAASGRVVIMPGCGITSSNASQIAKSTGAREFHAGLSSIVRDDPPGESHFEIEVRRLVETLATS